MSATAAATVTATAFDAAWLAGLQAQAVHPPRAPRQPLWAGDGQIGSIEADLLSQIELQRPSSMRNMLLKEERLGQAGWQLAGPVDGTLAQLAALLHDCGLAGAWRDELLAVTDDAGCRVGVIERGAVRPLGIATQAVHLVARTPDGAHWVQQRALDKPNDPGLWDTAMGGMVPACDTLAEALARETWEETGLRIDQLHGLKSGGQLRTARPARDGGGSGYVVERVDWFECMVPHGVVPVNQDGEVAQFARLAPAALKHWLEADRFTVEAALVLVQAGL